MRLPRGLSGKNRNWKGLAWEPGNGKASTSWRVAEGPKTEAQSINVALGLLTIVTLSGAKGLRVVGVPSILPPKDLGFFVAGSSE